jgi:hypothetical protein
MTRKAKPQPDNPEQFKRFVKTAREVEVDESDGALDRAFERVIRPAGRRRMGTRTPSADDADTEGD